MAQSTWPDTAAAAAADVSADKATVFVRNLPYSLDDEALCMLFSRIAPVKRACIIKEKTAEKKSRGFGFVRMASQSDAMLAAQQLNGYVLSNTEEQNDRKNKSGRVISVELAKPDKAAFKERVSQKRNRQTAGLEYQTNKEHQPTTQQQKLNTSSTNRETYTKLAADIKCEEDEQGMQKMERTSVQRNVDFINNVAADCNEQTVTKNNNDKLPDSPSTIGPSSKRLKMERDRVKPSFTKLKAPQSTIKQEEDSLAKAVENEIAIQTDDLAANIKAERTKLSQIADAVAYDSESGSRTVIISHIVSNVRSIDELPLGDFKAVIFPSPETTRQFKAARIVYENAGIAIKAVERLNNFKLKGLAVKAAMLCRKAHKVIIRNLPFGLSIDEFQKHFAVLGSIQDASIPKKPNGAMFGFGFITFTDAEAAWRAVNELNGTTLHGRPLAVDFALAKDAYQLRSNTAIPATPATLVSKTNAASIPALDSASASQVALNTKTSREGADAVEDFILQDDRDENSNGNEIKDVMVDSLQPKTNDSCVLELPTALGDADITSSFEQTDGMKHSQRTVLHKSNVSLDSVLFIRNVSYDTTEEQLYMKFGEYGRVKLAKLVMDKTFNRPKGTAFVHFADPKVAAAVMSIAGQSTTVNEQLKTAASNSKLKSTLSQSSGGRIILNGRNLIVTSAISREAAHTIENSEASKRKQDRRNLYLAHEGYIAPDSVAAASMSKGDLTKRAAAQKEKKEKLKNPNMFISDTRLSVRNLPLDCDEKRLKQIFVKSLEEFNNSGMTVGKPRIKQIKIARSNERIDKTSGIGRSKRYGFVEFYDHQQALHALRLVNNNPNIFTPNARPIVEFALYDVRKLRVLQKKLEQLKARKELVQQPHKDSLKQKKAGTSTDGAMRLSRLSHSKEMRQHSMDPDPVSKLAGKRKADLNMSSSPIKKTMLGSTSGKNVALSTLKPIESQQQLATDAFDLLVNQYKAQLSSAETSNLVKSKTKWFE